jgi:L-fuconolactonase
VKCGTRIDAHQHFWRVERGDTRWLTRDLAPLYRDFEPADLEPHLARAGIGATVLVQAADSLAETRFLLEIAARTSFVAGVVGWVPLEDPEAPRIIAELARDSALVGLRPMLQDLGEDDWILRAELEPALEALTAAGLVFDALVKPRHLAHLATFGERHPELRIVIDHAGKPDIAGGSQVELWRTDLRRLAARANTWCKLSGLASEAARGWTAVDLQPFVDAVFECFGPERVVWGSDWPVVELSGGFDTWWDATTTLLAPLTASERERVLGQNASELYQLS